MLFDTTTVEVVADALPAWAIITLVLLSYLGSASLVTPLAVLAYWYERTSRTATWLGLLLVGFTVRSLIKTNNSLSRPAVEQPVDPTTAPALLEPLIAHPVEISTTSFPSGHVMTAVIFWGLFVLDTDVWTRRVRTMVASTVVGIVALSRVGLASHYVGDVLAGVVLGLATLGVLVAIRRSKVDPVGAVFGLTACLSLLLLSLTRSMTGELALGLSLGVLAVWCVSPVSPELHQHTRPSDEEKTVPGLSQSPPTVVLPLVAGVVLATVIAFGQLPIRLLLALVGGAVFVAVPAVVFGGRDPASEP